MNHENFFYLVLLKTYILINNLLKDEGHLVVLSPKRWGRIRVVISTWHIRSVRHPERIYGSSFTALLGVWPRADQPHLLLVGIHFFFFPSRLFDEFTLILHSLVCLHSPSNSNITTPILYKQAAK